VRRPIDRHANNPLALLLALAGAPREDPGHHTSLPIRGPPLPPGRTRRAVCGFLTARIGAMGVARRARTRDDPRVRGERDGQQDGRRGTTTSEIASSAFDVVVAGLVLLVVWPVLVAIRLTMCSPVLFRHQRAGRHGATFELVKFRTMRTAELGDDRPDADEARLVKFGRLLRATGLDELPIPVNVLGGEIGLVGPRPLPIPYLPRYSATYARRHEVRSGITGWAQADGCNALTWDDQLDMDVWYIDKRSVGLDMRIIAATVSSVVRRGGVSHEGHATRPEFPGSGIDFAEAAM
jgi:sugar transferase EpsL